MTKATPGPWANIKGYIVIKSGHTLASVNSYNTTEGKANADMIAASRHMYDTLTHIAKTWPDSFAALSALSAIQKADGKD